MRLVERHLHLGPAKSVTSWRKLALGTWRSAKDPSVYGVLDFNAEATEAYAKKLSAASGSRVTVTHVLGRAVAEAFNRHPAINVVLRFGRLYPRRGVTVFFQVATDQAGDDLSGVPVRDAEKKNVVDIAIELGARAKSVRDYSDRSYARMKKLMGLLPGIASGAVMSFSGFVQFSLNLWSPLFGTPKDPMGSVMITNVGSLGLDFAFAPLVPFARVPMVIAIGRVLERPVVEQGAVVVRRMLRLCVTFDHRIIDGVHAAHLSRELEEILADPEAAFGGLA